MHPQMDSSHNNILRSSSQISQKEQARKYPSKYSRRTPSFSSLSSSSSSSYNPNEDSPLSPATPLRFSGVPFSWEQLPGIPKKQLSRKNLQESSSSIKLLPLPPPTINKKTFNMSLPDINGMIKIKKASSSSLTESDDPFFAAFVECSKDDTDSEEEEEEATDNAKVWNIANKVTRSLSDRFGLINIYSSCKRSCTVAESIRHLPKSTVARTSSYDLIKYRSR